MNAAPLKAVSINFYSLPTSKNIEQDYGMRTSTVSIAKEAEGYPEGLTVIGVYVNGLPQWTVPGVAPLTVSIRPALMQQGEQVEVRCLTPLLAEEWPVKPFKRPTPALPTTPPIFGLTPPETRRHTEQ